MGLKAILETPRFGGYPHEYLVSRIRARRAMLLRDWKSLLYQPDPFAITPERYGAPISEAALEAVWRHLLREYSWVYAQMDGESRSRFEPFFSFAELKTLFSLLRSRAEKGKAPKLDKLSGLSLLSGEIKDALASKASDAEIIGLLGPHPGEVIKIEKGNGLSHIEAAVSAIFISNAIKARIGTLIGEYFSYVADARNLICLYKSIRWELAESPEFIEGGAIDGRVLASVFEKKDMPALWALAAKMAGEDFSGLKDIQTALFSGLLRLSAGWGRGMSGDGIILDYLVRCMAEARNLAVLLYGRGMDREVLSGGMIF